LIICSSICIEVAAEAISRSLSLEYCCCHHKWQAPPTTTAFASSLQHSYTCSYPYGGTIIHLSNSNMSHEVNEDNNESMHRPATTCREYGNFVFEPHFSVCHREYHYQRTI
jgi:hypothetical protein